MYLGRSSLFWSSFAAWTTCSSCEHFPFSQRPASHPTSCSTKAVSKTDVSLSVPDRVAEGLSSVGLSTSVTLLVELSVAALLLQLISIEVIRQLVTFTVVALVVDYGMEMTFFATVLAIDLQRLEVGCLC